jgi:sugar fermentation stimulation protein A
MFPDAVTERGRRHLVELAGLKRRGVGGAVLFLVHTPRAHWFMPDYHTDLKFSATFLESRRELQILPLAIRWESDLSRVSKVKPLEIPWGHLEREIRDRGSYLLLMKLARRKSIEIGRLGRIPFRKGYYLYVGSAMQHLSARIARHVRKRKKIHWHIDFLRQEVESVVPVPIRSSRRDECEVARAYSKLFAPGPAGFGSSDCGCPTHLFFHEREPLHDRRFHEILQSFRMRPPH